MEIQYGKTETSGNGGLMALFVVLLLAALGVAGFFAYKEFAIEEKQKTKINTSGRLDITIDPQKKTIVFSTDNVFGGSAAWAIGYEATMGLSNNGEISIFDNGNSITVTVKQQLAPTPKAVNVINKSKGEGLPIETSVSNGYYISKTVI